MRLESRIRAGCLVSALALILALPLVGILSAGERYTILPNLEVDAREYDRIALELADHPSLSAVPPVFPPGFVFILALVYGTVGHSIVAAKILLWLSLVAATVLAGLLAMRVYETSIAGWTAAFLTASSTALQAYTGTLQYEVLVAALVLVLIFLALAIGKSGRRGSVLGRALVVGAALGIALLIRESLIALVPVFALFAGHQAVRARNRVRLAVAAAGLVLIAALLPALGWSAYQSRRAGKPMLIRDNVQGILPFGHNPYANGTWNVALQGVGEPSGIDFILSEPRRELWLLGRKAMYFWGILRDGWNVPRPAAVWVARASGGIVPLEAILPAARGGWILIALLIGCISLRKEQWRAFWLLPGVIGALMLVHLVTISSHRFAVPILPVAFVLAAGPLARVIVQITRRGWVVLGLVVVAALAMQTPRWPVVYRLDPTELDGVESENWREADGRRVRFANAAGGRRVAFALYDEYVPGGPLVVRLHVRRGSTTRPGPTPVARVRLFLLQDGGTPCDTLLTIGQLPAPDQWTQLRFACTLAHDGPARLIVETLGRVDLSFSDATLRWVRN